MPELIHDQGDAWLHEASAPHGCFSYHAVASSCVPIVVGKAVNAWQ